MNPAPISHVEKALPQTCDRPKWFKSLGAVVSDGPTQDAWIEVLNNGPKRPLTENSVIPLTTGCEANVAGLLECTTKENSEGVRSIFSV